MPEEKDPFFIGWEATPATRPARYSRSWALAAIVAGLAVAGVAAVLQGDFAGKGRWDFTERSFEGVFLADPYPTLVSGDSIYYVVLETKKVLPADAAAPFHLSQVTIVGSLIQDPEQPVSMIAVVSGSALKRVGPADANPIDSASDPQMITLSGEIADAKCALGAMNPGVFKPHRACAINCLYGGIPPVLIVRRENAPSTHYLLVSDRGEAMNHAILDHVALPVEIAGEVVEIGSLKIMKVAPAGLTFAGTDSSETRNLALCRPAPGKTTW